MQTGILKRELPKLEKKHYKKNKNKNQWEVEKQWQKAGIDAWRYMKKKIAKNKMRKSCEDVYTLILVFPLETEK